MPNDMECSHCGFIGPPIEKPPKIIICLKCKNSFDYFDTSQYWKEKDE